MPSPTLTVLVVFSVEFTVSSFRELGLREGHTAALAAVHPELPVPDETPATLRAVVGHIYHAI